MGHPLHEYNYNKVCWHHTLHLKISWQQFYLNGLLQLPSWGDWSDASDCASGCLYGPSKRLLEGSTGLRTYTRSCLDHRRRCHGRDHKYESCISKQCYNAAVTTTTIEDFATQVCERTQKFDADLSGVGMQIVGDVGELN